MRSAKSSMKANEVTYYPHEITTLPNKVTWGLDEVTRGFDEGDYVKKGHSGNP